jgi:hypothetical protein
VQTVPHGVGVAKDLRRGAVGRAARLDPGPEGIEQDRAFLGGQFIQPPQHQRPDLRHNAGALTAARASGVSSKTATSESADGLPVSASRANRREMNTLIVGRSLTGLSAFV